MSKRLIAAVIFVGALCSYAGAQVNFDQGVDVKAAIQQAVNTEANIPDPEKYIGHTRYTEDCARFTFGPGDADVTSEKVWFASTEYVEECYTTMAPGPNGTQHPVQQCYEKPGMTWRRTGQISIKARKLYPWERDSFDICLKGPWMDLYVNEAAYKYSAKTLGNYDILYTLTAQNKVAMDPDENGISLAAFAYDAASKKYSLKLSDIWANEYAGEKTAIKVELYEDGFWFFDAFKGEKEFALDPAAGYELSFAESDLDTSKAVANTTRGAKKYYVKWGFKRAGQISKDKFIKKGETEKIEVN